MGFFSGSFGSKVDSKGRFVLPQTFRYGLVENGVLEFTVALGLGGCLAIYRAKDIAQIVEMFRSKQYLGRYQKFFTLFFSTLHKTTCDRLGRVLLPPALRKAGRLKNEIILAGVLDRIELWPKEDYDRQLQLAIGSENKESHFERMLEDAFASLQDHSLEKQFNE